ncbi:integral membrane protein [Colletotrichum tabaci]|uniref:Integral membrane protein n=1 Tax=Colletotrichum tabaci TaxID=1209068 RepID=A0AAV9TLS6_9PEZI
MPPDESVGPIWLGVSSSLLVVLLVTTALRLWARAGRRNLGWDDYTIAAAALSATVRYAFGVMQLPHGNGRHRVYLTNHEYMMINMYGWWGQLFHFTSMAFLKVSLALLILRIKSNRTLKILLYAVIVGSLIINFGVVIILATSFGIVRAKSLGVSEADLSWDFCITAIWSNLELFLGISAANIALSRAVIICNFDEISHYSKKRPEKGNMTETVLVFGASGNVGVAAIIGALSANRHVIAVVRNQSSAEKMFKQVGRLAYRATVPYLLEQGFAGSTWTMCTGGSGDTGYRVAPAVTQGALFSFAVAAARDNDKTNIRFNEVYLAYRVQFEVETGNQTFAGIHMTTSKDFAPLYEKLLDRADIRSSRVKALSPEDVLKLSYEKKFSD